MKRKTLLFCLLTLIISGPLSAQQINLEYAAQIGGTVADQGNAIAVDLFGAVWSTGNFSGNIDLDPTAGVSLFTTFGSGDVYISKLDSLGNFLWGGQIGGLAGDVAVDISTDANGYVYVIGTFQGTPDFDPGAGVFNLTSTTGSDMFVVKLDNDGGFIWAKAWECDAGYSISCDGGTKIYATGSYSSNFDADPNSGTSILTAIGLDDIFIVKLDSSGSFDWAVSAAGSASDICTSIMADDNGNLFATGYFGGTVDFDPGAGISNLTSNGVQDIFIWKLDSSGSYVFAKQAGGTGTDKGVAITLDDNGNIYSSGTFSGTVDFDPGAGVSNLVSVGGFDNYYWKLDPAGDLLWANRTNAEAADYPRSLAADADENLYATGHFLGTVDFNPGSGTFNINSFGSGDPYLLKLDKFGDMVWAAHIGGTSDDRGHSIALSAALDIYSTGIFSGTAEMDPNGGGVNFTSGSATDAYVIKISQCRNATFPTINPPLTSVCASTPVQLTIGSGNLNDAGNWYWYQDSCGGLFIDSGSTITIMPDTTTNYFVRAEGGCQQPGNCAMINLIVNSNPVVELGEDTTICDVDAITLDAGPGFVSYLWSNGATTQTYLVDGLVLGFGIYDFSVIVTDGNGCTDEDSITVTLANCGAINEGPGVLIGTYPNPASDLLTVLIASEEKIDFLRIVNIQGQTVLENKMIQMGSEKIDIDISAFRSGTYYLMVKSKNVLSRKRFVKF